MKPTIRQYGLLTCICLFWLQFAGIVCFLYGFLPIKNPVGGYASQEDYTTFYKGDGNQVPDLSDIHKPKRLIGQLVFMVIDALRADFVFPFEYLNQTGLRFKQINNVENQDSGKHIINNLVQIDNSPFVINQETI